MRTLLGCVATLALCFGALAQEKDEKIDAKKLVGKWEAKEEKASKTVIEFTKDGKVKAVITVGGMELKTEGTYKLDGNKLSVTMKADDKEQTLTRPVTKLTDTELVTTDDKGKERTLTRLKDK